MKIDGTCSYCLLELRNYSLRMFYEKIVLHFLVSFDGKRGENLSNQQQKLK